MTGVSPCQAVQERFSEYLDGHLTGVAMQQIAQHLDSCPVCATNFDAIRNVQQRLGALAPVRAPSGLDLRLRHAISQERTRSWAAQRVRLQMQWENAFRPLILQASAGLAGTVVLLGGILFLLGALGAPGAVMANDEPLGAITAPHYLYSITEPRAIRTHEDQTIVVDARINSAGRVYDYSIVSGPEDEAVRAQVREQLLASVFRPASVFGGPVRGRAIMTFAGVSVRG